MAKKKRCSITGKRQFKTHTGALQAISNTEYSNQFPYPCNLCYCYHLTKQNGNLSAGTIAKFIDIPSFQGQIPVVETISDTVVIRQIWYKRTNYHFTHDKSTNWIYNITPINE